MNPTETTAPDPTVPDPYRQMWAEWDELAARYPTPTLDDVRPEWQWVSDHANDALIDPDGKYWGLHIAVYQQRVVGADRDPIALQIRLARELNIHPERMIVVFRGDYRAALL